MIQDFLLVFEPLRTGVNHITPILQMPPEVKCFDGYVLGV